MLNEISARLLLFSGIDPGNLFWSNQILNIGATGVLRKITKENSYLKIIDLPPIRNRLLKLNLEQLHNEISRADCHFITCDDLDWPKSLADLAAPPIGLLIKGDRGALSKLEKSIAVVGSRKPTQYGIAVAKKLAIDAANANLVVISGGAYGIDTAAHQAALACSGTTISVLAGGFNYLYPKENTNLFSEISQTGLLISEVMPSVQTLPARFLIRNRLIAALARATVVVEAEYVSGSIRTARDAADILRPVFAIPGQISSPLSAGCHRLIADRVADIATSLDEILELITPLQNR